jgi:hypothetical protein
MPEQLRERFTCDPFAITPDPGVYVPRAATETARKELLRSACNPANCTALIGPPGLGKTLLFHLLAEEAPEGTQTVYLPYAALPPEDLCAWALGLLGMPATDDPIGALQAFGRDLRKRESSLLMLIDDAGAMPIATARWARELVQNSGGGVRLAVAASDNATSDRTIAAIGSNVDIVHLTDPMTESETRKYIDERLALARAPDSIRARFDDRTVRILHRIAAGIPRRLHSAAAAILQEAPVATADGHADASNAAVGSPLESAVEDRLAREPIAGEGLDDGPAPDRQVPTGRTVPRRGPTPSRGAIALGSLLVAFVAVAIPVIRSALSEPRQIAVTELQTDPLGSKPADLREPSEAIEPAVSAAREAIGGILPGARAAEPPIVEPPADALPRAETLGPFAVQINASPWANVEIDGIDLGATPLANIPLFAGVHSFRVRMPDGRVIERMVEIDAEKRFISFE